MGRNTLTATVTSATNEPEPIPAPLSQPPVNTSSPSTTFEDRKGEPHVLQQKVAVYTAGVTEESAGYTKSLMKHRLVPLKDVVDR